MILYNLCRVTKNCVTHMITLSTFPLVFLRARIIPIGIGTKLRQANPWRFCLPAHDKGYDVESFLTIDTATFLAILILNLNLYGQRTAKPLCISMTSTIAIAGTRKKTTAATSPNSSFKSFRNAVSSVVAARTSARPGRNGLQFYGYKSKICLRILEYSAGSQKFANVLES